MYYLRKFFVHSPGHYVASGILTVAVGLFRFFTLPEEVSTRFCCFEVLSVSGMAVFLIGLLMLVSYFGAFDIFGYAFTPKREGVRKDRTYADYAARKAQERAEGHYYFIPYCTVGLIVLLLSFIFA